MDRERTHSDPVERDDRGHHGLPALEQRKRPVAHHQNVCGPECAREVRTEDELEGVPSQ